MIDQEKTFEKFGYHAKNLLPQSNKNVVIICDYCGKHIIRKLSTRYRGFKIIQKDTCDNGHCHNKKNRESHFKKYGCSGTQKRKNKYKKGDKFGFLTIISCNYKYNYQNEMAPFVLCKCICGNKREYDAYTLKSGHTKSCGCKSNEMIGKFHTKHGDSESPLYKSWSGMRRRCSKHAIEREYNIYYKKGIKICKDWENYLDFKKWALSHRWKRGLVLDRVDSNKNYCPENCEWVTQSENAKRVTSKRDEKIMYLEKENKRLKKQIIKLKKSK